MVHIAFAGSTADTEAPEVLLRGLGCIGSIVEEPIELLESLSLAQEQHLATENLKAQEQHSATENLKAQEQHSAIEKWPEEPRCHHSEAPAVAHCFPAQATKRVAIEMEPPGPAGEAEEVEEVETGAAGQEAGEAKKAHQQVDHLALVAGWNRSRHNYTLHTRSHNHNLNPDHWHVDVDVEEVNVEVNEQKWAQGSEFPSRAQY
ncbi:hypothetical protein FB45DRAFT_1096736 [Roridomyces roridus]|uniref:Uncharacterized protein n=1 Tax=Roridomyces roridus TaxID=1738132 RepID=A0AAD7BE34_9AGAR|nr:hypothetical protein FB45DRAFT_1096736 [Roridomyces roridus]